MKQAIFTVTALFLLAGCGVMEPQPVDLDKSLEVDFSIDRTEIVSGDRFTATYTIRNTTEESVEVFSLCASLANVAVSDGKEYINFFGTGRGCRPIVRTVEINPNETLSLEWDVHAFKLDREIGQVGYDTLLVAPGDYIIRVYPNIETINGEITPNLVNGAAFKVY